MIRAHVLCCGGTGCTSSGSPKIQAAFNAEIEKQGLADEIKVVFGVDSHIIYMKGDEIYTMNGAKVTVDNKIK